MLMLEQHWNPWQTLDSLQNAISNKTGETSSQESTFFPPLSVWANDDALVAQLDIPGIDPANVEIQATNETLTLRGNRQAAAMPEGHRMLHYEQGAGSFERTLRLPFHIDPSKVEARTKLGVLTITLPRAESEKPRKIAVRAEG